MTTKRPPTFDEFIVGFAERFNFSSVEKAMAKYLFDRCDCGHPRCPGWAMAGLREESGK